MTVRNECTPETLAVADWYIASPRYRLEGLLGAAWCQAQERFEELDFTAELESDVQLGLREDFETGSSEQMALLTCEELRNVLAADFWPFQVNCEDDLPTGVNFYDVARVVLSHESQKVQSEAN
ncbi:MAG: hypothetical protein WDZ51_03855 [Pirellulaceae bacterium]